MDERVMHENWSISASQHPRQPQLTAGRRHEIGPAYHQRDTLPEVIDCDGELVAPVPVAVSREQVTALLGWRLRLPAKQPIVEDFVSICELHTNSPTVPRLELPSTTSPVVAFATDVPSGAIADVDTRRFTQAIERLLVHQRGLALPEWRIEADVWLESEPGEILEQRTLVVRAATDAIVIFDAKQDAATERTRNAPDIDRVDDMPEVKIAGWRRRKAGQWRRAEG